MTGARLTISAVSTVRGQHPWAGSITPEGLVRAGSLDGVRDRRVTLRFASPTTFKSKGANVPFPLPGLVFGSLLNRWNAHCDLQLHPDARRFAEEMVAASKYQLRSRFVAFAEGQRGAATGCTGFCRYTALNRDPGPSERVTDQAGAVTGRRTDVQGTIANYVRTYYHRHRWTDH